MAAAQGAQQQQLSAGQLQRSRWITANENYIRENPNIKPCPQCGANIEKNGKLV